MSTAKMIEAQRVGAEIYHGEAMCGKKLLELLDEFSVPRSLIPMKNVEELGFNRSTRFFWLRQRAKTERKIKNVGTVIADVEVTGFFEQRHMANVTGVKGKELLIAVPVNDMFVGVPSSDKVEFKNSTGLYRVHPIAAFESAEPEKNKT